MPVKRLSAGMLLCLFLFAAAVTPITAVGLATYPPSAAFAGSRYAKNLAALPRTGDVAFDTVAVAMTQVGYAEGNGVNELSGEAGGNGNYTEYNRRFGKIDGTFGYPWCAVFLSFCLEAAGAGNAACGDFASCSLWVAALQKEGLFKPRSGGYVPKTGDLVFFSVSHTDRISDHVGLVRFVKDGRIYTVEGNSSNRVALRDYPLSESTVVGYGSPRYQGEKLPFLLAGAHGTAGLYVVLADRLNLRTDPALSGDVAAAIPGGTALRVTGTENGFGRTEYQGISGWISISYAAYIAPYTYTVTVFDGDSQECLFKREYLSFENALLGADHPAFQNAGKILYQDGIETEYTPGTPLPATDVSLTVVKEVITEANQDESAVPAKADAPAENVAPETSVTPSETDGAEAKEQSFSGSRNAERADREQRRLRAAGLSFFCLFSAAFSFFLFRRFSSEN